MKLIKQSKPYKHLTQTKDATPRQSNRMEKATVSPIVETNLKQKDLDYISKKIGEAIASVVIDEIISSQSSNPVPL